MATMDFTTANNINLILLGKTGHGKSSTGNSILGQNIFKTKGGGQTVTRTYQVGNTGKGNGSIYVVDTPGIYDNSENKSDEDQMELVINSIATGLKELPYGYSALLLVLSYTSRLTDEEIESLKALKSMLGEDSFRKHAICVFTHGDCFENDHDNKVFLEWCGEQECHRDLLEECGNRVVIFDNSRSADPNTKRSQVETLMSMVNNVQKENGLYTLAKFESEEKSRESLRLELKMPATLKFYGDQITFIYGGLSMILDEMDNPDKFDWIRSLQTTSNDLIMTLSQPKSYSQQEILRKLNAYSCSVSRLLQIVGKIEMKQLQSMMPGDLNVRDNCVRAIIERKEHFKMLSQEVQLLKDKLSEENRVRGTERAPWYKNPQTLAISCVSIVGVFFICTYIIR